MSTINETQDELIDEFSVFTSKMDKCGYILELGNALEPLEDKYKTPENKIDGCQSRVWITADYKDGKVHFKADGDAIIVKGLIALLIKVFSDRTPKEILDANLYFMDEIGMSEFISMNRSNGMLAMIKQMRMYALAFSAKEEMEKK